jgi:uncharacterized GH25 family protein
MKKILFLTVVCALISSAVSAHEFFVIPDVAKDYKAGDTVQIDALSTHYFTVGEELEDPKWNKVYIRQNGSRVADLPLKANTDRVWYETEFRLQSDDPVIVEGDRLGEYTSVFTDGSRAPGKPDEVKEANPDKTISEVRYLRKVSKTYLNPDPKDVTFSTPLGLDLEIIPLNNPANLKKGSKAQFRVLYKGQPLANAQVWATYDYYDYKTLNAHEQELTTDKNGEVTFKISNQGTWIIGLRDSRKSTLQGAPVTENNDSLLVFLVPKK